MSTPPKPTVFDWNSAWMQHRDCLPHLRQNNALYFLTFRLADSLPESRMKTLRLQRDRWLEQNPPPHSSAQEADYRRIWTVPIERLLDAGHGTCILSRSDCRQPLHDTLLHEDSKSYHLGEFVIMPNHVHVLVHVLPSFDLSEILQAWKSISARKINRLLNQRGTLWQPESFDHIVRSEAYWQKFIRYIRRNPSRLRDGTFTLGCGSLALEPTSPPPVVPTPPSARRTFT